MNLWHHFVMKNESVRQMLLKEDNSKNIYPFSTVRSLFAFAISQHEVMLRSGDNNDGIIYCGAEYRGINAKYVDRA